EIVCRRWFLVDVDPVRPAGIAATDDEHAASLGRARAIHEALTERGWPDPVVVDSGNGAHLLYAVGLPNDAASTGLIKRALAALALLFDDERVRIDQSTANAARLVRVPGTVNAKGDHTIARPHRLARLLVVPDPISVLPQIFLSKLAKLAPTPARGTEKID